MRTLITGAAGFVGRHLIEHLGSGSDQITGWYRPGTEPAALPHVSWTEVELVDKASVTREIARLQPTRVFHLAAAAHVAESWRYAYDTYQTNVLATDHLLSALIAHAPQARVLISGSATVYQHRAAPLDESAPLAPTSPYAISKLAQERLGIRAFADEGLHVVLARSFNHTGPGQDPSYVASGVARQLARVEAGLQPPVLRLGNLSAERDLTDVRDVVRAYDQMLTTARPATPYNVCAGRAVAIQRLVDALIARATVPVTIEQDPALLRPSDTPRLVGDHSQLTSAIGWKPEIALEQTLDDLMRYWRSRATA